MLALTLDWQPAPIAFEVTSTRNEEMLGAFLLAAVLALLAVGIVAWRGVGLGKPRRALPADGLAIEDALASLSVNPTVKHESGNTGESVIDIRS